jgi:hypothetical protein
MMEQFLDGEHDIHCVYSEDSSEGKIIYKAKSCGGTITVEETIKTPQEIKELIMPYGDIVKKIIVEYVRRNLSREYDKGETND